MRTERLRPTEKDLPWECSMESSVRSTENVDIKNLAAKVGLHARAGRKAVAALARRMPQPADTVDDRRRIDRPVG